MGQAKRRGTLEERLANPQGYPEPFWREWTAEEKAEQVQRLREHMGKIQKSLFSPMKLKKQRTRVKVARPKKQNDHHHRRAYR
jgi:hypothetical protein